MSHQDSLKLRPVTESAPAGVTGKFVEFDQETGYWISDAQQMPEFFMSLTSAGDHWMFVSSHGALSAGRCDSDHTLFPYYSADKISDLRHCTGPLTLIRTRSGSALESWEPFVPRPATGIHRNLYKNSLGSKVVFEEINHQLRLSFRYSWTFSHQFGFVRSCTLENLGDESRHIELLDGIQNLMPFGIGEYFQQRFSNLGDAYKKSELLKDSGVGLFYLSSIPTDRAEPSEGLRATAVWNTTDPQHILLSDRQLPDFLAGKALTTEFDVRAARGAYLLHREFTLQGGADEQWSIVADVNLDQCDVMDLVEDISDPHIEIKLEEDIESCQRQLLKAIAESDGIQIGGNFPLNQRHLSNVKFNIMRGGIPLQGYTIDTDDFRQHLQTMNSEVHGRNQEWLSSLPDEIHRDVLLAQTKSSGDPDLQRLATEYIPLVFSRRHGDPTRPWNRFAIDSHLQGSDKAFSYEGNWRDLFQNWEALAVSYPSYLNSMIWRFINASTADGYNPYRVMKSGFEWETPDPEDHWSNIGYWGDHQIVYLYRLLRMSRHCFPDQLDQDLDQERFVYADIPYRIRSMEEIFRNPQDTVDYDEPHAQRIAQRVEAIGGDGRLLVNQDQQISRATLGEKLLLPALVKMSNFVPDGGIWLNTQRPEWNDANNALVGNGLSMVTTCHLRRYLSFLFDWFRSSSHSSFRLSADIATLLNQIQLALSPYVIGSQVCITPNQRFQIVEDLCRAGSDYRQCVYQHGLSEQKQEFTIEQSCEFLECCLKILDTTIASNRRSDGLYHSYNLMSRDVDGEINIERLYEMLEGQVAVLNSGFLNPEQAVEVLDALQTSLLYRPDQNSFLLYPDRDLPRFLDKNNIPVELIHQSALLRRMLEEGDGTIVRRDANGNYHFNGDFRNAADVQKAVQDLATSGKYKEVVGGAASQLASIFENIFCHHQFTGRSGTFFAYEGLGSIYWHMVSKLALATIENFIDARQSGGATSVIERLATHYREIRDGIGAEKSPAEYGAFPSDPYSHTPAHSGVQQPGMTGQVKEDILSRMLEIGVRVTAGQISFDPVLLQPREFARALPAIPNGLKRFASLVTESENDAARFLFTLCGVPVVYSTGEYSQLEIVYADGRVDTASELILTAEQSRNLYSRNGKISRIQVTLESANYGQY